MKKFKLIKILPIFIIICIVLGIGFCLYCMSPVSIKSEKVNFKIESNTSTKTIINKLKDEGLIKSVNFTYLYVKLNKISSIKAGNFVLDKKMSLKDIFNTISDSKNIKNETINITFHEGKNMRSIVNTITKNTDIKEDEIYALLSDKEYINSLIKEYWFLDEVILDENIYYPLEGYLYPDTYNFNKDASIKDIFKTMLDEEDNVLSKYKKKIESSKLSVHQVLTLASMAELEGKTLEDRKNIIGVFFNRINNYLPLGSDVTCYYAAKVDMGDRDLYQAEIDSDNPYNTRPMSSRGKLPIGPICNPSESSINAAINYNKNNYFYFVADKHGKVYFSETDSEHINTIQKLKDQGLWYTYEE